MMKKRAFAFSISLAAIWMNSSFAELVSKTTASDSTLNMPLVYNMMAASTPHQTAESFTASAAETVSLSPMNSAKQTLNDNMHVMNGPNRTALDKLCQGKIMGEKITSNSYRLSGTCRLSFKPNNPRDWSRLEQHQFYNTSADPTSRLGTYSKYQQLCKDKKVGQSIYVVVNRQKIKGVCQAQFQPDLPQRN